MTDRRDSRPSPPRRPGSPARGRDGPDFDRLGDLLPSGARDAAVAPPPAAGRMTGTDDDLNQRLAAVWADAVGSEVAANARPAQLRDGRLVVSTSSSAWAHTLQLMSPMVVDKLNERLGEGAVKKAVFRLAGWDPSAAGVTQHPAPGSSTAAAAPTPSAAPATAAKPLSPGQPPAAPRAAGPATSGLAAAPPAVPVPARAAPADGLTPEEVQALADLDRQPLDPTVKARIREAMQAGFVRTRQDFGRS